tara:strand:+ start:965 stop:1345 length:381 start_codon:yes stop_codon:yes gene_type:complete
MEDIMEKAKGNCVKCGGVLKSKLFVLCALHGKLKCSGLMCVECGLEITKNLEESEGVAICPKCELEIAEELEDAGLYYAEDGGVRQLDGQLWMVAFRVVGSPLFNGMCAEKIHEELKKQLQEGGNL